MFLLLSGISHSLSASEKDWEKDAPAGKLRERCRDRSGNTKPDEEERCI